MLKLIVSTLKINKSIFKSIWKNQVNGYNYKWFIHIVKLNILYVLKIISSKKKNNITFLLICHYFKWPTLKSYRYRIIKNKNSQRF